MNALAYGQVIYGYRFNYQLLRVADGTERVCYSNSSHALPEGALYCPQCGSRTEERDRVVPSPVVIAYAAAKGLTLDGALSILDQYQYNVSSKCTNSGTQEDWILGVQVVDGGTDSCSEFQTMDAPERIRRLEDAVQLFTDLGLDPMGAKYYLLVQLGALRQC